MRKNTERKLRDYYKNEAEGFKLPSDEKTLSFIKENDVKDNAEKNKKPSHNSFFKKGYVKGLEGVAVILLIAAISFVAIYNNADTAKPTNPIGSTGSTSTENPPDTTQENNKMVITAGDLSGLFNGFKDDGGKRQGVLRVSENLKEAMECYKGEDVLFRVYIEFFIYAENFLEVVNELGVMNITSAVGSSEIYDGRMIAYFMELSEDAIVKISDRFACQFALATPERVEGYSVRISDYLTVRLSGAQEDETFRVLVAGTADDGSFIQTYNGMKIYNSRYNSEFEIVLPRGNQNTEYLNTYIDSILERNGITQKRIIDSEKRWLDVEFNEAICTAGFDAELTKAEIIKLANDPDVKAIYWRPQNFLE